MSSGKVRKIVEEIQKKDEICPQSFMVLVLKMQVLTESLEFKVEQNNREGKPVTTKRNRKKTPEKSQYIDGRKLNKSEIAFEEYVNEQFDTEDWLRKNGLIF